MPAKAVIDAVQTRLVANWTETLIVDYDTTAYPPDDVDAFLVHQYPVVNGAKPVVDRLFWEEGGIRFVLNVRRGIGLEQGLTWSDELSALFRYSKFDGVETFETSGPIIDDTTEEGDWISYAIVVRYRYEYTTTLVP